ncbi:MAG TPA: CoA-acylating methylmalonate-semialdehyde dehydrogenase [Cyclobacteriaceae bacterium]|nr:CoA-acylating methylmalonate-semialdehyde dehydrogenase [Cyclobacteriaceae bacterium]
MEILKNYINGSWKDSNESNASPIINPATQEILARVPLGKLTHNDVGEAVVAAMKAFEGWKAVPVISRVQALYKLKSLLELNLDDLAATITMECGKTLAESKGEIQRAIENVEMACGVPALMQSEFSENIAAGIDEFIIRQPVGVCACICPFNFPGMIAFWFLPYAIACGNTFIVKPSEKVPMTMTRIFTLIEQTGLPEGVVNLVHGGSESVDAILDHPEIKAVSFVGSSAVARYVYARGSANGKRVQAQGGAKNPLVILPDAEIEISTKIINDSVYGCAGQRCLAASNVITVGDRKGMIRESLVEGARKRITGYGLEEKVEMGPVITSDRKTTIENLISKGISEGASPLLDGRNASIPGYENGNFIKPTILENIRPESLLAKTEIFGPVMSLYHMNELDEAIGFINRNNYGNMACIFTSNGLAARTFRSQVIAGNIGINIGVAAPMAQFPFSGWKDSFFGVLHGQGRHAIEFFTQTKVVVERWPGDWSRKF